MHGSVVGGGGRNTRLVYPVTLSRSPGTFHSLVSQINRLVFAAVIIGLTVLLVLLCEAESIVGAVVEAMEEEEDDDPGGRRGERR